EAARRVRGARAPAGARGAPRAPQAGAAGVTRRRIIVGLEPRPHAEPLISAAAALAERLPAELLGLFVENVELLHFAALPFAREVGLASGMRRPLDVAAMERS